MKNNLGAINAHYRRHLENLEEHFKAASDFLVKCQIREPYVQKGILKGSVCPWEIGVADTYGLTILEDFHDTLEAMWVWSYYTKISKDDTYRPNIELGWDYVVANFHRFIPPQKKGEGLYDCSQVLLSGSLYEAVFGEKSHRNLLEISGDRLAQHLVKSPSPRKREYSDPWWMTFCLASAATSLGNNEWLKAARTFVEHNLLEKEEALFSNLEKEPRHKGPGGHDFFSNNANRVLALLSCFSSEKFVKDILLHKFLPFIPRKFVARHADENAWNANVATALGKSYLLTHNEEFLSSYFMIMDELKKRDTQNSSALPRSEKFMAGESWVTFFYAYAYAAVIVE